MARIGRYLQKRVDRAGTNLIGAKARLNSRYQRIEEQIKKPTFGLVNRAGLLKAPELIKSGKKDMRKAAGQLRRAMALRNAHARVVTGAKRIGRKLVGRK